MISHWILALVVPLAGCLAVMPPYIAPGRGETAAIFVQAEGLPKAPIVLSAFLESKSCLQPTYLISSSSGAFNYSTQVATDLPFSIRLHAQLPNASCTYIATFQPRSGNKYYIEPIMTQNGCGIVVFNVTTGERLLEETATKREPILHSPFGAACVADKHTPIRMKPRKGVELDSLKDLLPAE